MRDPQLVPRIRSAGGKQEGRQLPVPFPFYCCFLVGAERPALSAHPSGRGTAVHPARITEQRLVNERGGGSTRRQWAVRARED